MKSKKKSREIIQDEINRILAFTSQNQWEDFLREKGGNHNHYYHYTTLSTLKDILDSSFWQMSRADLSNDPLERPVHNASFTTSSLSSMGMWKMYSDLSSHNDIGVRIRIPKKVFKEIFSENAIWYRKDSEGIFHEFMRGTPDIFDIAYWHFGENDDTSLAIYRNYQLIGRSLKYHFVKGQQLPSYFKTAIWRKEDEVRVCCDFSSQQNVPEKLYLKINPELFKQMDFRLSPAVTNYKILKEVFQNETFKNCLYFFLSKILAGKLDFSNFSLPNEYEQWQ